MQIGVQHICRSTLCGTRVVLAAPDRDTAQWWADSLGRSEVEEVAEGYSYGANTIRDGVSLTPRRELRTLALPSEIMRLANLEGYLKFPGPFPVASIKLKYVARPAAAERFVPGEGGGAPEDRASGAAMPGANDAMTVPDTVGLGEIRGDPSKARADAPDRVPYRGEPKFVPLPGEAASAEAAPGRIADGGPGGKNGWRKARPSGVRKAGPQAGAVGASGSESLAAGTGADAPGAAAGPPPGVLTCVRSARSPRPPRARATTSATATTPRTIPSTARRAPGTAGGAEELGLTWTRLGWARPSSPGGLRNQ